MCTAKGSDVRPGVPRAPPLLRGRRGTMCTAKGSDVRPGVPRAPPLLRGRRGTMCTAKGSDVRSGSDVCFGVPWHSLTHSLTLPYSLTYQPQGMQKEFTKCAAALERVQNITLVSESMVSTPSF